MSVADTRTLSELFELLSHPRRRYVLHLLQDSNEAVSVRTLAKRIAMWEATDARTRPSVVAVESVRVSLHHTHLPKLADSGTLTYDTAQERIEPNGQRVSDFLIDSELRTERHSVQSAGR